MSPCCWCDPLWCVSALREHCQSSSAVDPCAGWYCVLVSFFSNILLFVLELIAVQQLKLPQQQLSNLSPVSSHSCIDSHTHVHTHILF